MADCPHPFACCALSPHSGVNIITAEIEFTPGRAYVYLIFDEPMDTSGIVETGDAVINTGSGDYTQVVYNEWFSSVMINFDFEPGADNNGPYKLSYHPSANRLMSVSGKPLLDFDNLTLTAF